MSGIAATDPQMKVRLSAFGQELRKLGWDDGQNVQIDYRDISGSAEQAQVAAKELLSLAPDVIWPIRHQCRHVAAGRQYDPDSIRPGERTGRAGFRSKLGQAGRQHHGLHQFGADDGREVAGAAQGDRAADEPRCGDVQSGHRALHRPLFRTIQEAAQRLAVQVSLAEVRTGTEIEPILDAWHARPDLG